MDFGLCLPNFRPGASPEGMDAAAETAERLGWSTVWTTDHIVVEHDSADQYGRIYEAIVSLAWLGGRHARVRLGTSVLVVPPRNAVILAKELATLDDLTGGRVTAGVGVGWDEREFGNIGALDRFRVRGAYLDETIHLWRHLWSGSTEPFEGRFHALDDFTFGPLPAQGADLPILVGGRADAAIRRAGTLGDGYHATSTSPARFAERVPAIRAAADAVHRPMPALSARVRVRLGAPPEGGSYALAGSADAIAAEVRAFEATGVTHLALWFDENDPQRLADACERFAREVPALA